MSRDQRAINNHALLFAQKLALEGNQKLEVSFCLKKDIPNTNIRSMGFMLDGLKAMAELLQKHNISFNFFDKGFEGFLAYLNKIKPAAIVLDFSPLLGAKKWRHKLIEHCNMLEINLYSVDAHNIVPVWISSQKEEYGAYTLRPKIKKLLGQYLVEYTPLQKMPGDVATLNASWPIDTDLTTDHSVPKVSWIAPGEVAARHALQSFLKTQINDYADSRNDPTLEGQSDLSPYLHFGHISAQEVALAVNACGAPQASKDAFLEELIVRKELADNYCFYNLHYTTVQGATTWAQKTIDEHKDDAREYIYSQDEFEAGKTHDLLWNAAQHQMVKTGKMHGFMRMYWAKKILEWTPNAQTALDYAVYLNDKYSLDGRDPNGYAGIMWSICGVHDRAWFERPIFGKIRYMNYNGCRRKFDVDSYIKLHTL